jgi:hypothetical protein
VLTLLSGVVLGSLGSWWSSAWLWAALTVFVLIGVVMKVYGGRTIDRIADTRDNAEMERLLFPLSAVDPRRHGGRWSPLDRLSDVVQANALTRSASGALTGAWPG